MDVSHYYYLHSDSKDIVFRYVFIQTKYEYAGTFDTNGERPHRMRYGNDRYIQYCHTDMTHIHAEGAVNTHSHLTHLNGISHNIHSHLTHLNGISPAQLWQMRP